MGDQRFGAAAVFAGAPFSFESDSGQEPAPPAADPTAGEALSDGACAQPTRVVRVTMRTNVSFFIRPL